MEGSSAAAVATALGDLARAPNDVGDAIEKRVPLTKPGGGEKKSGRPARSGRCRAKCFVTRCGRRNTISAPAPATSGIWGSSAMTNRPPRINREG